MLFRKWFNKILKEDQPEQIELGGAEHLQRAERFLSVAGKANDSAQTSALANLGNAHINAARLILEIQQQNNPNQIHQEWQPILYRTQA